jgi:assimilatory nitrate reductase catalytic subunit
VQAARWFANVDPVDATRGQGPHAVAVLPGPEPEQQRHRQEQHADQPAPGHRPDRQARRRPVQLTGQPNAMGGREVGGLANLLSAHRDLANPRTAPRWRAVGRADVPATPGKTAVEMFQAAADGEIKALWIVCTNPAQRCPTRPLVRARCSAPSSWCCRRPSPHRHRGPRRPAAAGHHLGREGRHRHQQRAPHQPRAPRRAAAGEARDDWRIAVDVARGWSALPSRRGRPGRCHAVPVRQRRVDLERAPRDHPRARPRHHRPELGRARHAPQQWPCPKAPPRAAPGCTRTAASPPPDGRARFVDPGLAPAGRAARRALPVRADHRPPARPVARHEPHRHAGPAVRPRPEPTLDLHPQDMARRALARRRPGAGDSRAAARLVLPVRGSDSVAPAQAFVAMHWGAENWLPAWQAASTR